MANNDRLYTYFNLTCILFMLFACTAPSRKPYKIAPDPNLSQTSGEFVKVDVQPILLNDVQAVYPEYALQKGIFGDVWVEILIDSSGAVRDALIAKDSGSDVGFEKSALDAAKKTIWKPAMADGRPVAVWVRYKVSFNFR